jgi:hypothetical protein
LLKKVNVGILFFFPEEGRVEFLYPNRLQRISGLYSDLNINFLKKYLKAFDKQAQKLTEQFAKESDLFERSGFSEIIETHFLKKDATALLFSDIKKGTYEDADRIIDYYRDQYLSVYDQKQERDRKDEKYIINKVEERIKSTNPNYFQEINREYTIETPYLSQQFNFVWQNGTTNLITPIGLDLKQKESIERKACTWRGKLETFQEKARKDNLKFDLIVSRPEDHSLFKTYENVLKILGDNEAPKEIIELENVNSYINSLSRSLSE